MNQRWRNIEELVGKLNNLLWTQRGLSAGAGAALTAALIGALWIVLTLIAVAATLPVWLKLVLLTLSALVAALGLRRLTLTPLFEGNVDTLAVRLEKRYQTLKGRLIAAVQFHRGEKLPTGTSPELVDLTAKQTLELAAELELSDSLDRSPWKKALAPVAGVAAVIAALILFAPGWFSHAYTVYSQPLTKVAAPLGYQLTATPADGKAVKYRDLTLSGHLTGVGFPGAAEVRYRFEGGRWQTERIDLKSRNRVKVNGYDSLMFSARLREVKRSVEFYVSAGARETEPQTIEIVDLPRVTNLKVSIVPPGYTRLPPTQLDDNSGSFGAVVGSAARIEGQSNVPLAEAAVMFDNGDTLALEPSATRFSTGLTVTEDRAYRFHLVDSLGEVNPDPIDYFVTALPDREPDVTVMAPGADIDIDESLLIPLKVRISDDFGFSSLAMKYRIISGSGESDETVMIIHYSDNITTDGEVEFTWDVDKIDIEPGDYISYYFEVRDNDDVNGPKVGVSQTFRARLPSIEELIAELDAESDSRINETENILKQERDLYEKLQETQRKLQELDGSEEIDWQKKQSLEELTQKNQELTEQLEKLADEMRKSLDQREGSDLMNQEIMEKMRRIQELFEEVATDEMRQAQERLKEALEEMNKQELEEAMKDMQLSQEELLSRLERTLELLKRMEIEQKINAMTEQAKELLDRQTRNNERTEDSEEGELAELAPDEDKVTEGLENLREQAEELDQMLREAELDQVPEAREFSDAVKQNDARQDTQEMSDQLKKRDKSGSQQSGESAEEKIKSMLDKMREQQQALAGMQQKKQNTAIRRAIEDATYLSREQEGLFDETAALNPRSTALRDLADDEVTLKESVTGFGDRLMQLSKQNPFLSSELRTLVQDAIYSINESVDKLHETRGGPASESQRDAMTSMNEVALRLLESMNEQSQCNKGGSCDKAGQKMESLGERQNKLNRETERQLGQGFSPNDPQEAERLRELAGEQQAIRRSLEELQREFGGRDELLGDLDAIGKEMEKVIEELSDGIAGDATAERQLRIYSR
ncbi:MAG TPA: hypothetical protein VLB27_05190, partial [candidate division Zixibacteria bacterium]|nr:hypothetical protein [candidate division Zixibacteria bacterium]